MKDRSLLLIFFFWRRFQYGSVGHVLPLNTEHAIYLHSGVRKEETTYVSSQYIIQQNMDEMLFGE